MWQYAYNLQGLYETPIASVRTALEHDRAQAESILQTACASAGRTLLTEYESKQLLTAYGIPTCDTQIAANADEAVRCAAEIGYPGRAEAAFGNHHSQDRRRRRAAQPEECGSRCAAHSTRFATAVQEKVGAGHFLGVTVQPMVKLDGYELISAAASIRQFGPVLLFGAGGQLVEVSKDRALALASAQHHAGAPHDGADQYLHCAERRSGQAAGGPGGAGSSAGAVQRTGGGTAVDSGDRYQSAAGVTGTVAGAGRARGSSSAEMREEQLPRPAIRPYPTQYVGEWTMKDGSRSRIRPIRPEDEPLMIRFHDKLSERSVYLRYFQPMKLSTRTAHERLTRICFIDYDREMALIAQRCEPASGECQVLGVGRLSKLHGTDSAELAVVILDDFQHQGLGTELVRRCIRGREGGETQACGLQHPDGKFRNAGYLQKAGLPAAGCVGRQSGASGTRTLSQGKKFLRLIFR